MSDSETSGGGGGAAGAAAGAGAGAEAGAVCLADQPNISAVAMEEPRALTKETLEELKFVDQDPQEYDPLRVGMATNDLDLDEVNDNLPDFGEEDNLSLEVNFGDGSSCRASDVSSLSFQNIVLDDTTADGENVEIFFRRDSMSDSSDSPLNEYSAQEACSAFTGRFEDELQKRREDGVEGDEGKFDQDLDEDDFYNTGTMKRRSKMSVASSESDQTNTACSDNKHCDGNTSGGGGGCTTRFTNTHSLLSPNANASHHALQEKSSQSKDTTTNAAGNESEATASNSGGEGSLHGSSSSHQGAEQPANCDQSLSCAESRDSETMSTHSADVLSHVSKRNSLEVRNNIPDVNEVKSYSDDSSDEVSRYQGQGAIPKILKKSPGLARRLVDHTVPDINRDTSSSEREMDTKPPIDNTVISAQKDFETNLRNGMYSPRKPHANGSDRSETNSSRNSAEPMSTEEERYDNVPPSVQHKERDYENGIDMRAEVNKDLDAVDVINEYDYVKYARIQHGDSYVGMRLAYSSSNDSLVFRDRPAGWNRLRSSDDEHYINSSREGSPEKVMQRPRNHLPESMRVSNVNEETLTEIPLNGNDGIQNDERRNFSLSPEATDCDSAEVESVLSEEGKSSTSGMPIVEDGLSSSQGSDTEDTSTQDNHRPAEILKRRHIAEIEQELQSKLQERSMEDGGMSSVTDNSSELSTPSHDNGSHRIQREALDLAIKDIQSAIHRSKSMTLKSPSDEANGQREEPIWVMR